MELVKEIPLKNGQILVSINDYGGEEDFYCLFDIIKEQLNPEHATYGVDSMCVDGSFRKDGILVRMSSECVTDNCCFHYDPTTMTDAQVAQVKAWIDQLVTALREKKPK
jgi:hypothetical protein